MSRFSLPVAVLLLAAWALFTFVRPLGLGIVHLLLAAGVVLLMAWWARKQLADTP